MDISARWQHSENSITVTAEVDVGGIMSCLSNLTVRGLVGPAFDCGCDLRRKRSANSESFCEALWDFQYLSSSFLEQTRSFTLSVLRLCKHGPGGCSTCACCLCDLDSDLVSFAWDLIGANRPCRRKNRCAPAAPASQPNTLPETTKAGNTTSTDILVQRNSRLDPGSHKNQRQLHCPDRRSS